MAKKGLESRKENRLKTQVKAYLTPKNNLIEVGQAKINFSMDVTNLESPEALTRYIMSDKNWGEQPFEDGPDTKSTPYEKEKRSLAKIADRVFNEIDNLEKTILHEDKDGEFFILPAHSYGLGVALEKMKVPEAYGEH